jgi:hypothetical protein
MNFDIYKKFIQGYMICDCAVSQTRKMAFVLKEDLEDEFDDRRPEELSTRVLYYAPDLVDQNEGFLMAEWKQGFSNVYLTFNEAENQFIAVDDDFYYWESKTSFEKFLEINLRDPFCTRSNYITYIGQHAYICGMMRKVFRREGIQTWKDITIPDNNSHMFKELRHFLKKKGNFLGAYTGFYAMDGFSRDELYAGGERGDMWHFSGKRWTQIDLPANFDIRAITCAGDRYVYASGYTGGILKGRGDHWKLLDAEPGLTINSSAWFDGQLFLSDNSGLWILEDDVPKPFYFPSDGPVQYSALGVKSAPDALVAYGPYQALVFDGKSWTEVIANPLIGQNSK